MDSDECAILEHYLATIRKGPTAKLKWLKQRGMWKQAAEKEESTRLPPIKTKAPPTLISSLQPDYSPYSNTFTNHQHHPLPQRSAPPISVFERLAAPTPPRVPLLPPELVHRKEVGPVAQALFDRLAVPKSRETQAAGCGGGERPKTNPPTDGLYERLSVPKKRARRSFGGVNDENAVGAGRQRSGPKRLDPIDLNRLAQPKYKVVWRQKDRGAHAASAPATITAAAAAAFEDNSHREEVAASDVGGVDVDEEDERKGVRASGHASQTPLPAIQKEVPGSPKREGSASVLPRAVEV